MTSNVGDTDKTLRVLIGLLLLSLVFLLEGNARWLGLIGLVPLMTAAMAYCPLYSLIGINTCSSRR